MATSAEKRAWLAANGHPELAEGKGRLAGPLLAEYDAAHAPADDYAAGTSAEDFEGPLDFVAADDPPEPDFTGHPEEPPEHATAEERPSRPHTGRSYASRTFGSVFGRPKGPRKPKPKGKTFRRVSIAPLIEDAYSDLAWAAAGIPPLKRLLQAQAPIAGVVLDPVVQGTVADKVIQPMARNYERMKVGVALVGTPMALMGVLVTAPEPVLAPVLLEDGSPVLRDDGTPAVALMPGVPSVQHQFSMLNLRYCVRAMADVAGGDALQRVAERAEANAARDDQVNAFIAWLLDIPAAQVPQETDAQEARDAGLKLAGVAQ